MYRSTGSPLKSLMMSGDAGAHGADLDSESVSDDLVLELLEFGGNSDCARDSDTDAPSQAQGHGGSASFGSSGIEDLPLIMDPLPASVSSSPVMDGMSSLADSESGWQWHGTWAQPPTPSQPEAVQLPQISGWPDCPFGWNMLKRGELQKMVRLLLPGGKGGTNKHAVARQQLLDVLLPYVVSSESGLCSREFDGRGKQTQLGVLRLVYTCADFTREDVPEWARSADSVRRNLALRVPLASLKVPVLDSVEIRQRMQVEVDMGRLLRPGLVSEISESTCGGAPAGTTSARRGRRLGGHKRALQAQVRPAFEVEHYGGAGSGNSELVPVAQGSPKRIMMQLGLHPLSQSARAIQLVEVQVVRANFCFDPSGKVTAFLSTVTKPIKAVGVIGVGR
jgi:hypothetical protein